MKLLVDGDGLIYRCGFAVEKTKYLIEDSTGMNVEFFDTHKEVKSRMKQRPSVLWSRKELEPVENALALVKGALETMPEHDEKEIWLSPSVGNFREQIATIQRYKGNRDTAKRPTHYREITQYLVDQWGARVTEGQEADDALGIALTSEGSRGICVSFDKDLDQIPGKHYNWVTKEAYEITPREGDFNLYTQILAGDPTDNVRGIEGMGIKGAQKLLGGSKSRVELWGRVRGAYEEKYGEKGLEYALETARLVYVRRQENELWIPPS